MDNVAHTLAGLALAEAGLKRRTALGTATLAIGANLPDVDGLIYLVGSGVDALAFRRGWTHGILAMALWPPILAGAMLLWHRLRQRRRRGPDAADARWLLALAAIGVWSHPLLDLLNTYGVRLLMPFSGRWFYGDTLFIVDPWLWLILAVGVASSLRRGRRLQGAYATAGDRRAAARPARLALGTALGFVTVMAVSSAAGRRLVAARTGPTADRIMVGPVPVDPFRRQVVRELGGRYEAGRLTWGAPPRYLADTVYPRGSDAPGAAAAARTEDGRKFLVWARFPRFESRPDGDSIRVRLSDVRYADERGRSWAAVEVTVAGQPREGAGR